MAHHLPKSLDDALNILKQGEAVIVAGGTDFYPALEGSSPPEEILDVSDLSELRGVSEHETGWRIGALTRWSDIVAVELPPLFDGLKAAARDVGSRQIQNAGTVAGNICNASPAADGVPPLLTMDARVELCSGRGRRELALSEFITGAGKTALEPDELVTGILVPSVSGEVGSAFKKTGSRKYLVISVVMVAVVVVIDEQGRISDARIAVGACSPIAQRLRLLEAAVIGLSCGDVSQPGLVSLEYLDGLSPISDVRASAEYRLDAAATLCQRALRMAVAGKGDLNE